MGDEETDLTCQPHFTRVRTALVFIVGVALLLISSGCGNLLFRQTHRITVLTPNNYSTIREPVVVSWKVRDFLVGQDGTQVVFVDRSPMPPGRTIEHFERLDREGIFQTDNSSIRFDVLSPVMSNASSERNHHEITIVLLDRAGRRIGEEAGFVQFNIVGHD